MKLHELRQPQGARRKRRRVGRGIAQGRGKTAGRGTKGTRARDSIRPFFEGGQMPLTRRVPKLKGFKNPFKTVYEVVNLAALERVKGAVIGPQDMAEAGLVSGREPLIKVLGEGELTRRLVVRAHAFSSSAARKIEEQGGRAEKIPSERARRRQA